MLVVPTAKPANANKPFVSVMLISPPSVCSITTLFKLSTLALTLFNADEPLIALAISVASSAAPFVVTEMIACEVVFVPFLVSLIVKEYVLAAIPLELTTPPVAIELPGFSLLKSL